MATWRTHRFVSGRLYKVLRNVTNSITEFREGEIVEFVSTGYSAHDSSTAFIFRACDSGDSKTWLLHDDDPDESCDIFVEVAAT